MLQNTKRITTNVLLAITLFTVSSLALASTQAEAPKSKNIAAQFVQTAKSATIVSIAEVKGEYKITLTNVDPYVSFFSDRPERVTGMLPLVEFIKDWNSDTKNSMRRDPPNVAIEGMQTSGEPIQLLGVLSQPKYEQAVGKMTYRFKLLSTPAKPIPSKIDLAYTVIFIDDMMIHWGTGPFG